MPAGIFETHWVKEQSFWIPSFTWYYRERSLRPWEGTSQACFLIFTWTCWFLPRQDASGSAQPGLCEVPGVDGTRSKNQLLCFLVVFPLLG